MLISAQDDIIGGSVSDKPMRFYEADGQVYCKTCRDDLLTNAWMELDGGVEGAEPLKPRSFQALGDRPWAGEESPNRYMQCDNCMGQWGPDA